MDDSQEPVKDTASAPKLDGRGRDNRPKLAPWQKLELCRHLAAQDITRSAMARKYGVSPAAITLFAKRNADRIQEVRDHLDDEFAGLWIARKANRVARYQESIEGEDVPRTELVAVQKAVAEELGQLSHIVTATVTHVLEGVDLADLT